MSFAALPGSACNNILTTYGVDKAVRLGFPTSDETPSSTGWISHFEHGYIRATGSSIIVFIG